jgi:chemotaxis protein CheD
VPPAGERGGLEDLAVVEVGLGGYAVSADPGEVLAAFGLGSCVGLVLCQHHGPCALAHVVLPHARSERDRPTRYADTAVPFLLAALGGGVGDVVAYLAGGASMFPTAALPDIGAQNVAVLESALARDGVALAGRDVGGRHGRTLKVLVGRREILVAGVGSAPRRWVVETASKEGRA